MLPDQDLLQRLKDYWASVSQRDIKTPYGDLSDVPLEHRAFQLAQNFLDSGFREPFASQEDLLKALNLYRLTVDALGVGRDVQVAEANPERRIWSQSELDRVKRGYQEEMALFQNFFPKNLFPGIYKEFNVQSG